MNFRDHYDQYETAYLLKRLEVDLEGEARAAIEQILMERDVSLDEQHRHVETIQRIHKVKVASAWRNQIAGRGLRFITATAIFVASAFLLYGFLRENGSSSPIKLFIRGDNDAASYGLAGVSAIFLGLALLTGLANRFVAFYAVLGGVLALAVSVIFYKFSYALAPMLVFSVVLVLAGRAKAYNASVGRIAALVITVPVYALSALILVAPLFH